MPAQPPETFSTAASSAATDIGPPARPRAPRMRWAFSSVGIEAVAKYRQISRSSFPGSRSTSALSVARPARPTCW
ncbi:Uncharacterised protein [Mycobacteroides abscessus subsp. abscessus]|nr:Uncharacterised protein [Mycobacteroides abscessus subsp. abscessus]